jgi:single-strand DNA-binding protein
MMNRWQGMGRLGRDPELKYTPGGTPVCNFSVACETSYKSNDEWKKETFWGDVVFFGKRAEAISQNINKGSLVYVEGRLQTRSWEKDGRKHSKIEVIGSDIKFLDGRKKEGRPEEEGAAPEETTDLEPF